MSLKNELEYYEKVIKDCHHYRRDHHLTFNSFWKHTLDLWGGSDLFDGDLEFIHYPEDLRHEDKKNIRAGMSKAIERINEEIQKQ